MRQKGAVLNPSHGGAKPLARRSCNLHARASSCSREEEDVEVAELQDKVQLSRRPQTTSDETLRCATHGRSHTRYQCARCTRLS